MVNLLQQLVEGKLTFKELVATKVIITRPFWCNQTACWQSAGCCEHLSLLIQTFWLLLTSWSKMPSYVLLEHPEVTEAALLAFLLCKKCSRSGNIVIRILVGATGVLVQWFLLCFDARNRLLAAPVAEDPADSETQCQGDCRPEDGVEDFPSGNRCLQHGTRPYVQRIKVTRHHLFTNSISPVEILNDFTIVQFVCHACSQSTLKSTRTTTLQVPTFLYCNYY